MTADRLLALYDRVADTPDAVSRLRRFVLDLAVRGKLVEQDPADEPASELLRRIAVEKVRMVKAGEIRKPRELADGADLVAPFDIPDTWCWRRLDTIGAVVGGGTPAAGDPANFAESGDGIPWLTPRDLGGYGSLYIERGSRDLSERGLQSSSATLMPGGTVLFTGRAPIGYVAIAARPVSTNQGFKSVVPFVPDCSRYIALAMQAFVPEIEASAPGTTFKEVSGKIVAGIPFPLPPLGEQHRIVTKFDELMALCDQLEETRTAREDTRDRLTLASLTRLSTPDTDVPTFRSHARFAVDALPALTARTDQVKHLLQTILNLAVRGKLVGHDPADEPALELLKRIAIAKSELKQKTGDSRIRTAHNPNRKDYPVSLPGSWEVQSFENLFLFVDYRGKTPPKTDAGVPLITAKNVRFGSLNREPREFIGQESFKAWMTRGFPQIGDLLFTTEAPMANICLNNIREPFALAQRVICLQPYGDICTRYFMFATMSNLTQTLIKDHSTGLTAKGIKAAKLKPIPIPIPPLVEQHRIVAKVDELMALCDRIEAGLAASDVTRSRLLESLLHDAFRTFSAS